MSHTSEDITVSGVRVRMQRSGRGDPLLFLHGAGGVMRWLPFFDQLAAEHELLVPDHPGFGASDDPRWLRHVPDIAMFYLELLEQLGLTRVHVVGHSLGGWIASEMAIRDRSRIRSMSLIAPAGLRIKGVPMGDPFIWAPDEFVRNLYVDQTLAEQQLATTPTSEESDVLLKNRFAFAKLAWQPRSYDPDLEKWLHRARVPALVVWGDGDKVIPASYAAHWGKCLPQASVEVIASCGHLPHVEKAGETAALIKPFIEGARA